MTLGIKPVPPFTAIAKPSLEPLRRWRCAISLETAQQTSVYTLAPTKRERLVHDSRDTCHTRSLSRLNKRWKEFHGSKDWEGLLDPLDDGLRGEIMRYGSFVEAAYQCFNSDLSSPSYATCQYTRKSMLEGVGVNGSGYRVTKSLHATSSIPMPHWIGQIGVRSSWIGYVAVCEDENEISRLGRRDIVISLRGTVTCSEWLENLRATLTSCPFDNVDDVKGQNDPKVETGVLSLYTSSTTACPSLQESIQHEILRIVQKYNNEPLSVTITGHSLGASLAILAAYDIKTTIKHALHLSVISFGGPRVGNRSFRKNLERQGTKILRIVNSDDLVTKVPGFFVEDRNNDVAKEKKGRMANVPHWMQNHVKRNQWVYSNIGHELRLSSRASLKLNSMNVATCHDLKTYLHLVNGFVSSTCPTSARMMLEKVTVQSTL